MSEGRSDAGEASFRRLASLGVTWVSIHTWDPLQRGLDEPVFAKPDRHFGFRDLGALVRSAHAAGLRVMVKPHLEMRGFEATDEERRIFQGPDSPARRALVARFEAQRATGEHLQHNRIAMRSEADWRRWFESYAAYILPYAREAQAAGADMFCVGREMDSTVVQREADWRALVARDPGRVPRAAHLLGQLRHLAGDRLLGRARLHRRLGLLPAVRPARPDARRPRGGLGPGARAARGRLAPVGKAGAPDRGRLPLDPERGERALARGAVTGRRVAAGPLPTRPRCAPSRAAPGSRGPSSGSGSARRRPPSATPRTRSSASRRPSRWRGGTPVRRRGSSADAGRASTSRFKT